MYLIAGLGNPGLKYRKTPHNAGFMALDALADALGARFTKKGNGKVAEARIGAEKVLLVKPQTFMNLSGDCIAPLAAYYKILLRRQGFAHGQAAHPRRGQCGQP